MPIESKRFSGFPWWANMLIGAGANFGLTYGTLASTGASHKSSLLGALVSTAAPFAGTYYQSRLNSDGSPQSEAFPPRLVWSPEQRREELKP